MPAATLTHSNYKPLATTLPVYKWSNLFDVRYSPIQYFLRIGDIEEVVLGIQRCTRLHELIGGSRSIYKFHMLRIKVRDR